MAGELLSKIKAAAQTNLTALGAAQTSVPVTETPIVARPKKPVGQGTTSGKIVAIGASSGGPHALRYVLPRIPGDLDAAILVADLLGASPGLKILATSREALDIVGETIWPVPSLSLPDLHGTFPAHTLSKFESIRLFMDRALSVRPGFELLEQNAKTIVQICQRLEGMPLAIELAAARIAGVSPADIAVLMVHARRTDRVARAGEVPAPREAAPESV